MKLLITLLSTAAIGLSACGGNGSGGGDTDTGTATKYIGASAPQTNLNTQLSGGMTLPNGDVLRLSRSSYVLDDGDGPVEIYPVFHTNPNGGGQDLIEFTDSDGNTQVLQEADSLDTTLGSQRNTYGNGPTAATTLTNVGYQYVASQNGVSSYTQGATGTINITSATSFNGQLGAATIGGGLAGNSIVNGTATLNGISGQSQGYIGESGPSVFGSQGEFWGSNGDDGFTGNWNCDAGNVHGGATAGANGLSVC